MTRVQDLVGVWELVSFELKDPDGRVRPWGRHSRGLLVYSDQGYMSAVLNRDPEPGANSYKSALRAVLSYSGTFSLAGDVVTHHVKCASWLPRIGRDEVRYISWKGDCLVLEDRGGFGTATITWRRAAPFNPSA